MRLGRLTPLVLCVALQAEINAEVYQRLEQLGLPLVWLFLPGSGTNPMDQSAEVTPNTPELEAKNKAIRVRTPYTAALRDRAGLRYPLAGGGH